MNASICSWFYPLSFYLCRTDVVALEMLTVALLEMHLQTGKENAVNGMTSASVLIKSENHHNAALKIHKTIASGNTFAAVAVLTTQRLRGDESKSH